MNKKLMLLLITAGAVGLLAAGCGVQEGVAPSANPARSPAGSVQKHSAEDTPLASAFELTDLQGNTVSLYDAEGEIPVTLLVFWATWCPACREEIPAVKAFNKAYAEKGVRTLSISVDKGGGNVSAFAERAGIDYTVLLDKDNAVAAEYGVVGIPNVLVLDRKGRVRYNGHSVHEAQSVVDSLSAS